MEISEIINEIAEIFLFPSVVFSIGSIGIYFLKKDKIYRYPSQGWLPIEKYPIPEDIKDFIVTDGKVVETVFNTKWNRVGKPVFGYNERVISYWQPLPDAPKNDYLKLQKG